MLRLWIAILAALVPTTSVAQFRLQDARPITPKLIKAGRLLDVRTGRCIMNQSILTDGERIKEVGSWELVQSHAPKEAAFIDLSRATLLPELIDSHSHLMVSTATGMSGSEGITTAVTLMSSEFRTLLGAFHAKEYL